MSQLVGPCSEDQTPEIAVCSLFSGTTCLCSCATRLIA